MFEQTKERWCEGSYCSTDEAIVIERERERERARERERKRERESEWEPFCRHTL